MFPWPICWILASFSSCCQLGKRLSSAFMSFVRSGMCLDAAGSYKGRCFFLGQRWLRAAVVGKTKMCCPQCPRWTRGAINKHWGGMAFAAGNKPFSRPTNCDLGLFAICMSFKKRKRDWSRPPGHRLFLALSLAAGSSCLTWIKSTSVVPLPCGFESPFVPTLSAPGTQQRHF